jgi:hypothetical protein
MEQTVRSVLGLRRQPQQNLRTVLVERTLAVVQPSSEVVAVPLVPPEVVVEVVPPLELVLVLVQEQELPLGQVLLVLEQAPVLALPLAELRHS